MSEPQVRVAHIGVAVPSLPEAAAFFHDVLGLDPSPPETADGAQIVSLAFGDVHVELLTPDTADGPIARFIAKRGPGLHHVCFDVDDLDAVLERCREKGLEVIGGGPEPGAQGKRVAFLHPRSTGGVLIELAGA